MVLSKHHTGKTPPRGVRDIRVLFARRINAAVLYSLLAPRLVLNKGGFVWSNQPKIIVSGLYLKLLKLCEQKAKIL